MKCMPQKAMLSKQQRAILDREINEEMLKINELNGKGV